MSDEIGQHKFVISRQFIPVFLRLDGGLRRYWIVLFELAGQHIWVMLVLDETHTDPYGGIRVARSW